MWDFFYDGSAVNEHKAGGLRSRMLLCRPSRNVISSLFMRVAVDIVYDVLRFP